MNRTISYFVLAGGLSTLAINLVAAAPLPEPADRPAQDRGSYRDKNSNEHEGLEGKDKERDSSPQGFLRSALLGGLKEVRMSQIATERSENADVKAFAQRMIQDHTKLNDQLRDLAQRKGWTLPGTNYFDSDTLASPTSRPDGYKPNASTDTGARERVRNDVEDTRVANRENRDVSKTQANGKESSDKQSANGRWDRMRSQGRTSIESLRNTPSPEFDKTYAKEVLRGHMTSVQKYEQASQNSSDSEVRAFAQENLPKLKEHHRQAKELAQALGVTVDHDGKIPYNETEKRRRE